MKKYVFLALAVLFLASTAFAALGDIIASWELPISSPRGVAKSIDHIYYLAYQSPNVVVRLDNAGSFVSSWTCPHSTQNRGLAYSWGGYIWVGCYGNDQVYCCNADNGSVYYSWDADHDPYGLAPFCTGNGGAGTTRIITYDYSPDSAYYHILTNGSVTNSTPLADEFYYDLAYDWLYRLIWKYDSSPAGVFGMYYMTGSVLCSFPSPSGGTCFGIAYHGTYLYIACSNNWMYQVQGPLPMAITPASMGGIKAIFR
ncbi:MAG: hypothetical protein PVH29_08825 [Candidatus Zixiibacteriota bacterium]|jgi:hypothetical protein